MTNSAKNTAIKTFITEAEMPQGSAEWLEWRNSGIGGSDAAVAAFGWRELGVTPPEGVVEFLGEKPKYVKTPAALVAEKTGAVQAADLSGNPNIARGKAMEPLIRQEAESRLGATLEACCLVDPNHAHRRVSLDGLNLGLSPRIIEIKAPGAGVWEKWVLGGSTQAIYAVQLAYQATVAKAALGLTAIFGSFVLGRDEGSQLEVVILGMPKGTPKGFQGFVLDCVDALWAKMQAGESVESVDDPMDMGGDKAFSAIVARYKAAKAAKDKVDAELKEAEALIKESLAESGRNKVIGFGLTASSYYRSGSFDWAKFAQAKGIEVSSEDKDAFTKDGAQAVRISLEKTA